MGFPTKKELAKVLVQLEKAEGSLSLAEDASALERFRFDICQRFVAYKLTNKINQKELAKVLGIDEPKVSKILRYRIEEFSTDRLIDLYSKLNPNLELRVG